MQGLELGLVDGARGWVVGRADSWEQKLHVLGFGVGSSSPQFPGHQTSTCDLGINSIVIGVNLFWGVL